MREYWERRLHEAREVNDRIEAELEVALATAGPEAAEPVRAVIGAATATGRRRYAGAAPRTPAWQEQRHAADGVERVEIVTPRTPHHLQITIFSSGPETVPAAPALAEPALARRMVGPIWYRGLIAGMYALASNFILYAGLTAVGAVDRIPTAESLPMVLAITSVLCALTGTVAFAVLRTWFDRPDTPFRLVTAAALLALLVAFVISPGATYLGAIVAVVMTSMSLGSDVVSD